MARIRSIKPEFWQDERLAQVEPWVRLLFIGLWNVADEEGRLRGSHKFIRAQIFPYDAEEKIDVAAGLGELERIGRIVRYESNGETYVWIRRFTEHQRVDPRLHSKLPPPPVHTDKLLQNTDSSGQIDAKDMRLSADKSAPERTDKCAPSREQVAGSREQETGDVDPPFFGRAPPKEINPPVSQKPRQPTTEYTSGHPAGDSLRDRMEAAWLMEFRSPYAWSGKDDLAMSPLLRLGNEAQILERWKRGIAWVGFPMCRSLTDLSKFWNSYAKEQPQKPEARRDRARL